MSERPPVHTTAQEAWLPSGAAAFGRVRAIAAFGSAITRLPVRLFFPYIGVIAFEGSSLGGVFVSFDKKAVRLIEANGKPARLLA